MLSPKFLDCVAALADSTPDRCSGRRPSPSPARRPLLCQPSIGLKDSGFFFPSPVDLRPVVSSQGRRLHEIAFQADGTALRPNQGFKEETLKIPKKLEGVKMKTWGDTTQREER
ncbi:hypothetical protein KSP40_PGU002814 [Platanthera guangdongensis]|uniref:Uncharacterized protein n=1 Tax=Platanthera guangdongensis TaxID=2320717 RepID=A0ABR2LGG7_9ASPA